MAGKHRKRSRRAKKFTAVGAATKFTAIGAATATATALTVGVTPLPDPESSARSVDANVDLAAAITPFPDPDQIPDVTGGLGSAAYDFSQTVADVLIRAIVENINLAALANAAGLSPEDVLDNLLGGVLGEIPAGLLDDVVGSIPIDVSAVVDALLGPLGVGAGGLVGDLVAGGLPDTLGGLLGLLGIDLSDALNLSDLTGPVNIITAGPPFTLLKLLGVDLGWVPGLPNSVANEINDSEYLDLEVSLGDVLGSLPAGDLILDILAGAGISIPTLDVVEVRVPVVVGFGLGAFAAATAYDKVLADLENQPGGANSSEHPLLGSITVLPMILLFNPATPNGGPLARMYPLFGLFGINTVNPDTEVTSSGGIPILNTGLSLGGANLIPILINAGIQYHPSSDFAAWPNPVSLANNLMAGLLPTYILRGLTLDTVPEQLTSQLTEILAGVGDGPLHLNLYLTIPSATLPLLEPFYLASDVLNLVTLGALPVNPFNLVANAFAPVLTSAANLGYTDVVFNPVTGAYERTLTEAGVPTPFMSFPDIDWGQVPGVLFNQLLAGIEKEFLSGNPTPGTPNALTNLLGFLGGLGGLEGLLGGLGLEDLLGDIVGGLNPLGLTEGATTFAAATDLPDENARTFTLSTEETQVDESHSGTRTSTTTEEDTTEQETTEEDATGEDATDEDATDEDATDEDATDEDATDEDITDEDAANDEDAKGETKAGSTTPNHPGISVSSIVRGMTNAFGPKHAKPDTDSPSDNTTAGTDSNSGSNDGASDNAA